MPNEWFAIRTKSNREYVVAEALAGKGYEVLFPRYSVRAAAGPLFPGYLFCRFDVLFRLPILTVPGVLNIVSNGRIPVPLADREIDSIKVLMSSHLPVLPHPYLRQGDVVRIEEGPLAGAEGTIIQTDSKKLVVSITLLQRSVAVNVSPEWIGRPAHRAAYVAS
jgi:transcription antitermination factor NusG